MRPKTRPGRWTVSVLKRGVAAKYHALRHELYSCLRSVLYVGWRFKCPFCRGRFRKMLPFGLQPRPVKCPRCHSIDRERTVFLFLKKGTNLFHDRLRILHFAPEPNLRKILGAAPNLDYVTADVDPARADEQIDITDIPYEDNSFDVVICVHVLEHVEDDCKALSEILRVLKPGGWALPLVPLKDIPKTLEVPLSTPEQRLAAYGQSDHVRQYGLDYENRLVATGFSVKIIRFEEQFSDAEFKKYALLSKDDMYVTGKPQPS